MKKVLVFLGSVCISLNLIAQGNVITGKVCDENGKPLSKASVWCFGTHKSELTRNDGTFEIAVSAAGDSLECSYVGYYTRIVPVSGSQKTPLTVNMTSFMLDVTQVVGFPSKTVNVTTLDKVASNTMVRDVPFLLESAPSVVATSETGTGIGYTNMRVRGTEMARINVTIDGIPLNDAESQDIYWVNFGDFSSSVSRVDLQRGVGSSTNGTSSFGASMNFETKENSEDMYGQVSVATGSFNTQKYSVSAGTGLIANHLMFDARYSFMKTDGWVQRSNDKLQSFDVGASYKMKHSLLAARVLAGKQKTGITWEGLPAEKLEVDLTYNPAGSYTDENGNEQFYSNETDNYTQTRYLLSYKWSKDSVLGLDRLAFNASLFATKGDGYYEQYKGNAKLASYGLGTTRHDLIRQKCMDNIQYGYAANLEMKRGRSTVSVGNSYSIYDGDHFGKVIWIKDDAETDISKPYYENNGLKKELNAYARLTYQLQNLTLFADAQARSINYEMNGFDDDLTEMDHTFDWMFWNPKFGAKYKMRNFQDITASFAIANREPTRANLKDAAKQTEAEELRPEHLYDFEFGYRKSWKKLAFTANLYYMQYKDQLVQTGKLNDVGDAILENVTKSFRRGVELTLNYRPAQEIEWCGNITLSQNKIRDYVEYATDYDDDWNEIQKITELGTTDISYSPNVVASHTIMLYPVKGLSLGIVSKFVGKQYFDNTSSDVRSLDAYSVHDFQSRYVWSINEKSSLDFQFLINNLLDKNYISNGYGGNWYEQGKEQSWIYYFPQAGIHYTVKVSYTF